MAVPPFGLEMRRVSLNHCWYAVSASLLTPAWFLVLSVLAGLTGFTDPRCVYAFVYFFIVSSYFKYLLNAWRINYEQIFLLFYLAYTEIYIN